MLGELHGGQGSALEHLSNLCTMIVVAESNMSFPMDSVLQAMQEPLQHALTHGDGDVAVMSMRTAALLLEKFLRSAVRCTAMVPFLKQLLALADVAAASVRPDDASRKRPPALSRASSKRGSAQAAPIPLVFASCRPHELGEELLRCVTAAERVPAFAAVMPSKDRQLELCICLTEGVPPAVVESSLLFMCRLLRSGGVSDAALTTTVGRLVALVDGLASSCAFVPDWDAVLCQATHLALVASMYTSDDAGKLAVKRSFLNLGQVAWGKNPSQQRLHLITNCVVSVVASTVVPEDLTGCWAWLRGVLEQGVLVAAESRKIGNPFTTRGSNVGLHDDDDDDERDGVDGVLPNRTWVPEDSKVMVLYLLRAALGIRPTSQSIRFRYLVAWRNDQEEYHRYTWATARSIVEGYLDGKRTVIPLPRLSRHHQVQLGALTQLNTQTNVQRPVFLQPIPTVGTAPQVEFPTPLEPPLPAGHASSQSSMDALYKRLVDLMPLLHRLTAVASSAVAAACAPLATSIMFCVVSRGVYDSALNDAAVPTLQAFLTSDEISTERKVLVMQRMMDADALWADVLLRAGAAQTLSSAIAAETAVATKQPDTKRHRRESGVAKASSDDPPPSAATALFAQFEQRMSLPTSSQLDGVVSGIHLDALQQEASASALAALKNCTEDSVAALLVHHTQEQLAVVMTCVKMGVIPRDVFQTALCRSMERLMVDPLVASKPRQLTPDVCCATSIVNICAPDRQRLMCPNQHPLKLHHSAKWLCNQCGKHRATASMACRVCDYDLCTACAQRMNPQKLEVSHCATVGDLLRYLKEGKTHVLDTTRIREAILRALSMDELAAFQHLRPILEQPAEPSLFRDVVSPLLALDTEGTLVVSAGTTIANVQKASRRYAHHHHHQVHTGCLLHIHDAQLDASKGATRRCKCPTDPVLPLAEPSSTTPRHAPRHGNSKSSPPHAPCRSPPHHPFSTPLSLVPNAGMGRSHLEGLIEACRGLGSGVIVPSISMDQLVVDTMRAHATDVFIMGTDGIPAALRSILCDAACQKLISLPVRVDIMKFCAVECRRSALLHMFSENLRPRGTVSVNVQAAPVPSKFEVHRSETRLHNILTELDASFAAYPTLRSKMEFHFAGEEGTGDGPTQELYTEVSCALVNEPACWYHTDDGTRVAFPSQKAHHATLFRVLGSCYARAFADGFTMDLSLTPAFWECAASAAAGKTAASGAFALHQRIAKLMDPTFLKHLRSLEGMGDAAIADLVLSLDDGTPVTSSLQLHAFIAQQLSQRFATCADNVRCFVEGFMRVLDPSILQFVDAEEMDVVWCGRQPDGGPLFSEDELRAHVIGAHGYTNDSPEVQRLIEVVVALTPREQAYFVEFLTGSPRLPLGGIAGLSRPITVARKEFDCGDKTLPSCNTCFLYFKLPPYKTAEATRDRLLLAITEGRKNFSLS